MNLYDVKNSLPKTDKNVIVVLSGGLDSSSLTMILVNHYGSDRVKAISFDYGQKQKIELQKASELCKVLGINHRILDLGILGEIARPFSANIAGTNIEMPTIKEVIGEAQPPTYVPNRNMIMYSLAASVAEVEGANFIFCGLQTHDSYFYYDTTKEWVDKMNATLSLNRKNIIEILSPFSQLSKLEEIDLILELGQEDLFKHTLTCYNPNEKGESCGVCPTCEERIAAFAKAGFPDPIQYFKNINWDKMIDYYKKI